MSDDAPKYISIEEIKARRAREGKAKSEAVKLAIIELADFYAFMPMHNYIFAPARQTWPGASVNSRIAPIDTGKTDADGKPLKIKASAWLDSNRPVEQMSWLPGE